MRLDRLLCELNLGTRSQVKKEIKAGLVSVNGVTVLRPEEQVREAADLVCYKGQPCVYEEYVYYLLHKPAGVVSSTDEPGECTVLDLLGEEYRNIGLFPAGRLDKDTEGLLLLTNDGPLAHRLLAPRSHVDKVYYVETDGELDEGDAWAVRAGITLADGYVCLPGELELLSGNCAQITLREGKYHQVKRMLAARGKPVVYLKRVRFGPLVLDEKLPKGGWRALTEGERQALFRQ